MQIMIILIIRMEIADDGGTGPMNIIILLGSTRGGARSIPEVFAR